MRRMLTAVCLIAPLLTAPVWAQSDRPSWANVPAKLADAKPELKTESEATPTGIREVIATPRDLITLTTKLRFTSLILLPDDEEIMDVVCGDKDFWVISTTRNIVHVKPAKEGAETNLNLVTASGAVYSFLLREVGKGKAMPDLRVSVKADEAGVTQAPARKWVAASQLDAVQAQLIEARAQLDVVRRQAEEQIATAKRAGSASLICDYGPVPNVKPFFVQSICRSEEFTYIRTDAKELPALYEVKDGMPSILNFNVEHGTYVVPKVLENAYLAIGKARLPFALKAGAGN